MRIVTEKKYKEELERISDLEQELRFRGEQIYDLSDRIYVLENIVERASRIFRDKENNENN